MPEINTPEVRRRISDLLHDRLDHDVGASNVTAAVGALYRLMDEASAAPDEADAAGLVTRYYIGLIPDTGMRVALKYGPDPAEKFAHLDPHDPLDMDVFQVFPVGEAVWREWAAEDEDETEPAGA